MGHGLTSEPDTLTFDILLIHQVLQFETMYNMNNAAYLSVADNRGLEVHSSNRISGVSVKVLEYLNESTLNVQATYRGTL